MDDWKTRETLLMQVRNRYDENSWADFDQYYRSYIHMIIKRMGASHHDSEDLTQQVLLNAWKELPEFDYDANKGRFRGWLCRVTGNATKNFFKKNNAYYKRHEKATQDSSLHYAKSFTQAEIEQIAKEEWEIYISNLAWKNIEPDLADNIKETFLLLSQGIEATEIAKKLEIERNTVYVYKKRVTKLLYAEINRLDQELG